MTQQLLEGNHLVDRQEKGSSAKRMHHISWIREMVLPVIQGVFVEMMTNLRRQIELTVGECHVHDAQTRAAQRLIRLALRFGAEHRADQMRGTHPVQSGEHCMRTLAQTMVLQGDVQLPHRILRAGLGVLVLHHCSQAERDPLEQVLERKPQQAIGPHQCPLSTQRAVADGQSGLAGAAHHRIGVVGTVRGQQANPTSHRTLEHQLQCVALAQRMRTAVERSAARCSWQGAHAGLEVSQVGKACLAERRAVAEVVRRADHTSSLGQQRQHTHVHPCRILVVAFTCAALLVPCSTTSRRRRRGSRRRTSVNGRAALAGESTHRFDLGQQRVGAVVEAPTTNGRLRLLTRVDHVLGDALGVGGSACGEQRAQPIQRGSLLGAGRTVLHSLV
mmetsp:Transcript_15423/g.39362  ORF Transcript_15423/g.39362 Transcript_15423/m.39362 type:complete len:389 (+) Transcript_15423:1557-2723(+)